MKNLMKEKNGITLIALVITIIILLILAGISIGMLSGDNSIIKQAGNAKTQTDIAQEKEILEQATVVAMGKSKYGNVEKQYLDPELSNYPEIGGTEDAEDGIEVTFKSGRVYLVDTDGNVNEVVIQDRTGINVGDYIDYEPDEGTYEASKLGSTYTGTSMNSKTNLTTNVTTDGTTTKTVANWRVLRIYDNGSIDIVGDITTYGICLSGARGYNNGPRILNDICSALYSKSSKGVTARSIDIDDFEVEGRGNWKEEKQTYINSQIAVLKNSASSNIQSIDETNNTVTYSTSYSKYPNIYAKEKGAGIDTTEVNTTENEEELKNNLDISSNAQFGNANTNGLTATYTYYRISINNYGDASRLLHTGTDKYFIASRYVSCNEDTATFGIFQSEASYINGRNLYSSTVGHAISSTRLKPVIHLKSSVSIEVSGSASTTSGTPHHIDW